MEPYNDRAASAINLSDNNNWMRRRQGLALPVLPPTTLEARKYFFTKICEFSLFAVAEGKGKVNHEAFAQEWNQTADGITRFYVTAEILASYTKSWEKTNNILASQEIIATDLQNVSRSAEAFVAHDFPFPSFITGQAMPIHPQKGVLESMDHVPSSSSISIHHRPSESFAVSVSQSHASAVTFVPPRVLDISEVNMGPNTKQEQDAFSLQPDSDSRTLHRDFMEISPEYVPDTACEIQLTDGCSELIPIHVPTA